MGLRARKSVKIAPGVRMSFGLNGVRTTFGGHGITYSIGGSRKKHKSSSSRARYKAANAKRKQLAKEMERAAKERQKQIEIETAKATVEEFNARIEEIQSMHKSCIEPINWDAIINASAPFPEGDMGPNEKQVREKMNGYKPGFFAKNIKSLNKLENGAMDKELNEAIEKDQGIYAEWKFWNDSANAVAKEDLDGILGFIQMFNLFDDFTDFGSGFDVGLYDSKHVEVDFYVMPDVVVPSELLSLTSTGKLSTKNMPVSKRYDIIQDYVCSGALRIARDIMSVLPVEEVIIHAVDTVLNSATGKEEEKDILSVKFDRETMGKLNYDALDPSDSMVNFQCNMKFLKTKGFQEVSRLSFDEEQ